PIPSSGRASWTSPPCTIPSATAPCTPTSGGCRCFCSACRRPRDISAAGGAFVDRVERSETQHGPEVLGLAQGRSTQPRAKSRDPKLGPRKLDIATMYNTERYRPMYANKRGLPVFLQRVS